jgi:hypothetical protein
MGDKPNHPFRGNQYTASGQAGFTGTHRDTAPDLDYLSRENKIPAQIADVPTGGGGKFGKFGKKVEAAAEEISANVDALHADKITHKQFREEQRRLWDAANNRGSKFGERLAQVLTDEVRHRNERIDREDIRRERLERRGGKR